MLPVLERAVSSLPETGAIKNAGLSTLRPSWQSLQFLLHWLAGNAALGELEIIIGELLYERWKYERDLGCQSVETAWVLLKPNIRKIKDNVNVFLYIFFSVNCI